MRTYNYGIEYLAASEAATLTDAKSASTWQLFANRSQNSDSVSPVIDTGRVTARYVKLTVLSADLPTLNAWISTILQTDNADRVSVFVFKVFDLKQE